MIYVNDDPVMEHVIQHYRESTLPIVFSGVNKDPAAYGLEGSRNVTGVLEREHFIESVRLLAEAVPTVRRIAVVVDDGPTWDGVLERMKSQVDELPGKAVARRLLVLPATHPPQ